jgi:nicotinate-nucleotide pyrophosphorylase (carboxylating)
MRVKMLGMGRFYTIVPMRAPPDLEALSLAEAFATLVPRHELAAQVARALAEDLGAAGDVTSAALVPAGARARAVVRARAAGTLAGMPVALETLAQAAPQVRARALHQDGDRLAPQDAVLELEGPLRGILAAERTLLNYLCHLCGVATLTATFVAATQGTRARICDTRKTTPGLRLLEKYAVRCGGGTSHRIGLFDAMLVKDNHIADIPLAQLGARLAAAAASARAAAPLRFVEVECDSLEQLRVLLALPAGTVDMALLDNMDPAQLAQAVHLRDAHAPALLLEASGGVRLETVARIAAAGVDRISVGALTHSAPALDLGLDIAPTA